jgi:hypothetical protein
MGRLPKGATCEAMFRDEAFEEHAPTLRTCGKPATIARRSGFGWDCYVCAECDSRMAPAPKEEK